MSLDVLSQLAGHVWLCEPRALEAFAAKLRTGLVLAPSAADLQAVESAQAAAASAPLAVEAGIAQIRIAGMMMPKVSPFLEWVGKILGIEFTSTEAVRAQLDAAVNDPRVTGIHLAIHSPGGTVDGTAALADDIGAAADLKPMTADARELMCSAAMWAGAAAGNLTVGKTAVVGSIGVFTALEDWSGAAAAAGVKVHVIASGPAKGGAHGAPIPPEKLANIQAMVDAMAALFTAAVAKGRRMTPDKAAALSTGEVWVGAEAVKRGLADAVTSDAKAIKSSTEARASEEKPMPLSKEDQDRIDALERRAAEAEALAKSAAESLKAVQAQRREDLVAKYPDRVVPANRAAVLAYGEFCGEDLAKFEAHIKSLPPLTRPAPEGSGGDPDVAARPSASAMTDEQRKICRAFGFKSWAVVEKLGARGNTMDLDGTLAMADGSFVPKANLQAYVSGRFGPIAAAEREFFDPRGAVAADLGALALIKEH